MTLRIGRIPYLNTEPFFADDQVREEAVASVPRRMVDLALSGEVDLAPLPVVAAFDHPEMFKPIGDIGIATIGAARSVLLLSMNPVAALGATRIGVIDETATSVRLLKVLLRFRYGVDNFVFVDLDEEPDAMLLIGDRALLGRPDPQRYPHVLDLAAEWHAWTGHPFVFACWMVRRGVLPSQCTEIMDYFESNLTRNLADPTIIHSRRQDMELSPGEVETYIRTFCYRFDEKIWEGFEHFKELDMRISSVESVA